MRIYLGGHLNFYHPQKENWLEIELALPTPLVNILDTVNIPKGEVQLVVFHGEKIDLQDVVVDKNDEVRLYSAVGGG